MITALFLAATMSFNLPATTGSGNSVATAPSGGNQTAPGSRGMQACANLMDPACNPYAKRCPNGTRNRMTGSQVFGGSNTTRTPGSACR